MQQAPPCLQVSVVLALALPFLSLSFGYNPTKTELDQAAQVIKAHAEDFDGWEVSSLLWAAARLGYRPSQPVVDSLLQQVKALRFFALTLLAFAGSPAPLSPLFIHCLPLSAASQPQNSTRNANCRCKLKICSCVRLLRLAGNFEFLFCRGIPAATAHGGLGCIAGKGPAMRTPAPG